METNPDDPYSLITALGDIIDSPFIFFLYSVVLTLLLVISALISGSEVAFFSLTKSQIDKCRESKKRVSQYITQLLDNPRRLLATILILNNFVNIAFITFSTYVTWEILHTNDIPNYIYIGQTLVVTILIVFFGEIVPKVYANNNNLGFAKKTASILYYSGIILKPVSAFLMLLSNVVERRLKRKEYQISRDDLSHAVKIATDHETTQEEKDILKGIVNFGTISVEQIMRSRIDITSFDIEDDFHKLMDMVNKGGYSRIPVYKETIDSIQGILYIKDLLPYLEQSEKFEWQKLLRPGYFVPETKKIDDLLKDFQEKRVHMAIVVDEYGGTSGLITMEDIIEEIIGEINDEFDDDEIVHRKLDDNTYIFEGKTSLNDFCRVVDEELDIFDHVKGESKSLGGLILELNTKLPRVGEKISYDRFLFTIVSVDVKRIKRIRVLVKDSVTQEPLEQKAN